MRAASCLSHFTLITTIMTKRPDAFEKLDTSKKMKTMPEHEADHQHCGNKGLIESPDFEYASARLRSCETH